MKCKMLLLPLLVGMAFCAQDVSAKNNPSVGLSHKKNGPVFIENKGQITDQNLLKRSDIDFKLTNIRGCNIFIGSGAIHYQWVMSTDKKGSPFYFQRRHCSGHIVGRICNCKLWHEKHDLDVCCFIGSCPWYDFYQNKDQTKHTRSH